mgnify:CR=1 FL=1
MHANSLTYLSMHANSLTYLSIHANSLTCLSMHANSLTYLSMHANSLTCLSIHANSLTYLSMHANSLTYLSMHANSLTYRSFKPFLHFWGHKNQESMTVKSLLESPNNLNCHLIIIQLTWVLFYHFIIYNKQKFSLHINNHFDIIIFSAGNCNVH